MAKTKNILVCPLDWGLGHATRMVPVIDLLLKKKANVIIGGDNRPLAYLKSRFPACEFVVFPGYSPEYPEKGSMALSMIGSYPGMISSAKKANAFLQEIIQEKNIDVVVSDNRYELSSKKAYSVFITHQLKIQTPGVLKVASPFITRKINSYIRKYDELWIPDVEGTPNLSGKLSHDVNLPIENTHFIGPLSRFSLINDFQLTEKPELLILLSGPEPQRTILEKKLTIQALGSKLKTIILQGKPEKSQKETIKNVTLIPHLPDEKMASLIKSSKLIITRPGYSTIMDLAILGKKAVFIPTPGQTEQEYLASKFKKEGAYYAENQNEFQLKRAIENNSDFSSFSFAGNLDILKERIDLLISN